MVSPARTTEAVVELEEDASIATEPVPPVEHYISPNRTPAARIQLIGVEVEPGTRLTVLLSSPQAPGYCVTANTAALRADETRYQEILGRIPAGRWGQPEDLGGAVVFLCAPASDYFHGIGLPVDGGWLAR